MGVFGFIVDLIVSVLLVFAAVEVFKTDKFFAIVLGTMALYELVALLHVINAYYIFAGLILSVFYIAGVIRYTKRRYRL